MTALSEPRSTPSYEIGLNPWRTFKVKGDAVIYPGAMVALTAAGYLVAAATSTTQRIVGVAAPKRQQMTRLKGYIDATGIADGVMECEVQGCIAPMVNSSTSITIADIGNDCYVVDDQTVHRTNGSTAGTAGIWRGDVVFNGTDLVGLTVDGYTVSVASDTDDDTTATALRNKWNADPVAKLLATATIDTSGSESWIYLTFLDTATHTVVSFTPATADVVNITNPTPAVAATAATRSRAGKVWQVESGSVWVCLGLPS